MNKYQAVINGKRHVTSNKRQLHRVVTYVPYDIRKALIQAGVPSDTVLPAEEIRKLGVLIGSKKELRNIARREQKEYGYDT